MITVVNGITEWSNVPGGCYSKGEDGYFGNPFNTTHSGVTPKTLKVRQESVEKFREWFYKSPSKQAVRMRQTAMNLLKPNDRIGCLCTKTTCHCPVIAEWANRYFERKKR